LSQDQTLQQNLLNNRPGNIKVAKGILNLSKDRPGYCHNWHWLIKHPVEFSKNNRTSKSEPVKTRPSRQLLDNTRSFSPDKIRDPVGNAQVFLRDAEKWLW
ncbi:hypothetical protein, partial [Actinoplanes campanulatus]|uniref:hypothetical protein n=1 Tax=Actinoplanes campanulatus TaxID=113559 RepID=UPI0031CE8DB1